MKKKEKQKLIMEKINKIDNINLYLNYREYECDKCNNKFYDEEGYNIICPHCENYCNDDVMGNWEDINKVIEIELDRKTGKITVLGKIKIVV